MGNVLLVIPPGVRPRRGAEEAIARAVATGGSLVAVVLLDPSETARIAETLDSAFMGERVSDRLVEVLAQEQRTQADSVLGAVGEQARARGVPYVARVEQGDAEPVCARMIREHHVSDVVLLVARRSLLSRLLSRSAAVKLPALANCALTVIEEADDDASG